jgi:hypothetical protein
MTKLEKAITEFQPFDYAKKEAFRSAAMAALRALAKKLGVTEKGVVRFNPGVPCQAYLRAPSAPSILHTSYVYVIVYGEACGDLHVMWRSCNGKKDYTGGMNQWATIQELEGGELAERIKQATPQVSQ